MRIFNVVLQKISRSVKRNMTLKRKSLKKNIFIRRKKHEKNTNSKTKKYSKASLKSVFIPVLIPFFLLGTISPSFWHVTKFRIRTLLLNIPLFISYFTIIISLLITISISINERNVKTLIYSATKVLTILVLQVIFLRRKLRICTLLQKVFYLSKFVEPKTVKVLQIGIIISSCFVCINVFRSSLLVARGLSRYLLSVSYMNSNDNPLCTVVNVIMHIATLNSKFTVAFSAVLYSILCCVIKCFYDHIKKFFQQCNAYPNSLKLIYSYNKIADIMIKTEDIFSLPVFLKCMDCFTYLFIMIFQMYNVMSIDVSLFEIYSFVIETVTFLSIAIPAINASESGKMVRSLVETLPLKFPKHRDSLNKHLSRHPCNISLTMAKTFQFDRKLIFGTAGTLLSYGIILSSISR